MNAKLTADPSPVLPKPASPAVINPEPPTRSGDPAVKKTTPDVTCFTKDPPSLAVNHRNGPENTANRSIREATSAPTTP